METVKNRWNSLNELGSKGYESFVQLGEINLRTMEKLASRQMDAMNLFMENATRQSELATQAKGLNDLIKAEAELTKEFGNRLMGELRQNLELAGETQKSYRAWFEKGLADVTEKASGLVR